MRPTTLSKGKKVTIDRFKNTESRAVSKQNWRSRIKDDDYGGKNLHKKKNGAKTSREITRLKKGWKVRRNNNGHLAPEEGRHPKERNLLESCESQ